MWKILVELVWRRAEDLTRCISCIYLLPLLPLDHSQYDSNICFDHAGKNMPDITGMGLHFFLEHLNLCFPNRPLALGV